MLNRFGCGFSTSGLADLRAAGGTDQWLQQQLAPTSIPEDPRVATVDGWFPALRWGAARKWQGQIDGSRDGWIEGHDLANWSILRRIYSRRVLLETMTDFWSTHLHIPVTNMLNSWVWRADYDATLRTHALGTFEDLLREATLHPAMRLYLDNWRSVAGKPNENHGRELLELHTVGPKAGYSESEVLASAKLLSGFTVDWLGTFEPRYDTNRHTTGAVQVLGFSHPNTSSDGQAACLAYLRYLAHHPETAATLARKLAQYFVRDDPSDALVARLVRVYLDSGTDISALLTELASHPEFLTSEGLKVRAPFGDLVATARVLETQVDAPPSSRGWAWNANYLMRPALYTWPRPDGAPVTNAAWSSVPRLLNSVSMHADQSGGSWPPGATYRSAASWLPAASTRLDVLVDHLSRTWLGRPADQARIDAAVVATRLPAAEPLTASHPLIRWEFHRLAAVLLDSPDHMTT